MKTGLIGLGLLLVAAGCGSGGASADGSVADGSVADGSVTGACRANSPFGATMSWLEDGAPKCAVSIGAQRSTNGTLESLQLGGVTLDGANVGFGAVAYDTVLEGTHPCSTVGSAGTPGTVYVDFTHPGTKEACSVTITAAGTPGVANATGTFSATFTGMKGAVITNGVFDTPVMGPPTATKK